MAAVHDIRKTEGAPLGAREPVDIWSTSTSKEVGDPLCTKVSVALPASVPTLATSMRTVWSPGAATMEMMPASLRCTDPWLSKVKLLTLKSGPARPEVASAAGVAIGTIRVRSRRATKPMEEARAAVVMRSPS